MKHLLSSTPLTGAAAHLEVKIAELLISYGADKEKATSGGQTPLELAQNGISVDMEEESMEERRQNMVEILMQN